jgi:hypothetical protein
VLEGYDFTRMSPIGRLFAPGLLPLSQEKGVFWGNEETYFSKTVGEILPALAIHPCQPRAHTTHMVADEQQMLAHAHAQPTPVNRAHRSLEVWTRCWEGRMDPAANTFQITRRCSSCLSLVAPTSIWVLV